MPTPAVDCCCEDCDCQVCLTVACAGARAADFGVYPSSDGSCTGTPVVTGTYDGSTPACFCLPAPDPSPKTYDLFVAPTDSSNYKTRCTQLVLAVEDCGTTRNVGVTVEPYTYDATFGVYACSPCVPPGGTYTYEDGYNTINDSIVDGLAFQSDLTAPSVPASISLTWHPPACLAGRYDDLTSTATISSFCGGVSIGVTATAASGYVCVETWIPLPVTLAVSSASYTSSVSYDSMYTGLVDMTLSGRFAVYRGGTTIGDCHYDIVLYIQVSDCEFTGAARLVVTETGGGVSCVACVGGKDLTGLDFSCGFPETEFALDGEDVCGETVTISE